MLVRSGKTARSVVHWLKEGRLLILDILYQTLWNTTRHFCLIKHLIFFVFLLLPSYSLLSYSLLSCGDFPPQCCNVPALPQWHIWQRRRVPQKNVTKTEISWVCTQYIFASFLTLYEYLYLVYKYFYLSIIFSSMYI